MENKMEIDPRNIDELYKAFTNVDSVVMKKYFNDLQKNPICDLPDKIKNISEGSNFQVFKVLKIVYDKDEHTLDKLTTVYNTISSYDKCSLVMILTSDGKSSDIYLGTICRDLFDNSDCNSILRGKQNATLKSALLGNFPGTEIKEIKIESEFDKENNINIINNIFKKAFAVSSVNGIAAIRNEKESKTLEYVQGIEKFIDSMRGKKYSALFIADVVNSNSIQEICTSYEDIYSQLSPFLKSEETINSNESKSNTESIIKGTTDTTNSSISKSISHGVTKGTSTTHTVGGSIGLSSSATVGGTVSANAGIPGVFGGGASVNTSATVGTSITGDYHYAHGKTVSDTKTDTDTSTEGTAKSLTEQNSVAKALTSSNGQAIQICFENRTVKTLLERIDEHIKRLRSCEDFGVFDCGAYFISGDTATSISAANTYKSLMRGENSSIEVSAINTWESKGAEKIFQYLKKLYHPLIAIPNITQKDGFHSVTPTSLVSGRELPIQIGLPKKSVSGIPVIECAEFGRDVYSYDGDEKGDLDLGFIYHMHHKEDSRVLLDKNSLTSHTFVTGSTGSGKSNTIYNLINKAIDKKYEEDNEVRFLVIEPAKGEYKNIFGHRDDVFVYGTNPNKTDMLRINPFKFPEDIHILEHLDRLIEIFNVCWPMYAAMPAILKDSFERAYINAGWDLKTSTNKYNNKLFPSFQDVLEEIHEVLDESDYSSDNKGDYTGALVTRIRSLTNGINGMIFVQDDLGYDELFDRNVIVDLSRIGSTETKSLIMGLLIIKLQEYRMSQGISNNSKLRHLTVLEEAHNLLRRTSTEQSTDSSNLLGKSVEMLSNAIAEMRTYGEGFIIADQSPGLLDMSVIRNTNTKIILRLPDFSDRELVGKAAGLNDNQIIELAKLQCGVAAVYQNHWINPVLCKVDYFESEDEKYEKKNEYKYDDDTVKKSILDIIMNSELIRKVDRVDVYSEEDEIITSSLPTKVKCELISYIKSRKLESLQKLAFEFFNSKEAIKSAETVSDIEEWKKTVINNIVPDLQGYTDKEINLVLALIIHEQAIRESSYNNVFFRYMEHLHYDGGVK